MYAYCRWWEWLQYNWVLPRGCWTHISLFWFEAVNCFWSKWEKNWGFDSWVGKDPLEKEMATHSSVLTWRISDRGAWWATVHVVLESRTQLSTHTHAHTENSLWNLMCRSNQSILKEMSPGCSLEGLMLNWNSNPLATWCKELTHLKISWCWERLKAGGEGDDRGWDGWMASPTQCTWVWVNSGSYWWTGKPGMLQSMGSQSQTWLSN